MKSFKYMITNGNSINIWKHSDLIKEQVPTEIQTFDAPVNQSEGYQEVEYPVRTNFLQHKKEIKFPSKTFDNIYCGFENPRVDFSTFQALPHKVSTVLQCTILSDKDQVVEFLFTTCGRGILWLDQQQIMDFAPYARNHGTSCTLTLPLKKGSNELILYMDDLAERDVNFFVELQLVSDIELTIELEMTYEAEKLSQAIDFLNGIYLEKDYYSEGDVIVHSDLESYRRVLLTYSTVTFSVEGGGDITDFEREDSFLEMKNKKFLIGNVADIQTSGLTTIFIGVPLPDGHYLYKKLVFCLYNETEKVSLGNSIEMRKKTALENFADLDIPDMNSALAELFLGHVYDERIGDKLFPAYTMIQKRGDCADFMLAPLLSFTVTHRNDQELSIFLEQMKDLAIHFRYWIDEPGKDVMWYFSENHSLLFHICQYLAGYLYPEDVFEVSQRQGEIQYEIGKKRLLSWFEHFESYGFSEWNSTTYLPIDLIGFFSLYNAAPDKEIRDKAKHALDFTFKIMAVNFHSGTLSSTFGRTYEHDLKAMRIGEISNILAVAWNKGNFNHALRATTVFCLSDYEPPKEYMKYIDLKPRQYLTANYLQGINQVETYLYKCDNYSIASAIRYNCFKKGHQQHMMNISLGNDGTQLWINNPGEYMHSGENRPSYWAGNDRCPCIIQYKNTMSLHYDLSEAYIKKIHLYLPFWSLSEIDKSDPHWLFIRKNKSYLAICFSEGYQLETKGATRNREIYSLGENHLVLVKCSNEDEVGTFTSFCKKMVSSKPTEDTYIDFQWGKLNWSDIKNIVDFHVEPSIVSLQKEGNHDEET
ncbi:MAG TPA: hypothetical protein H9829_02375 [Candidatus Tetragenococcus pullicola]|nr:hypothetical protein [Candidatus Tetragenococcus pullicola]